MLNIATLFPRAPIELLVALEAAPKTPLAVNAANDYKEALSVDDPRYVETTKARADKFVKHFYSTFGYDAGTGEFSPPRSGKHVLFFGHVGCGKSTELNHLCQKLHDPERYWVVKVDLLTLLDPHNVSYSDVWLAVAQQLLAQLEKESITVPQVVLSRLENWFKERVLTDEQIKDFSAEIKTEAEAGVGVPFLARLLARFTTAIKIGSTHREQIRTVVRNTFSEFIDSLNLLFAAVDVGVTQAQKGKRLLLMIDGPDRFRGDDWRKFFIDEGNQLTQAACIAVYTAPIALKANGRVHASFDSVILPMIKLHEFDENGQGRPDAYMAMRQVLLKRCHYSLFDGQGSLDALIDYSGGHLRDALRLLSYVCADADEMPFTHAVIDAAAKRLAGDFRDWLSKEHYKVLVEAARTPRNDGVSDAINKLVEEGALLEYNSGSWRQPHPVLRLLYGYQQAEAAAAADSLSHTG